MVKTPRTRHSQPRREPLTIELGAEDVTRVDDKSDASQTASEEAEESVNAGTDSQEAEAQKPAHEEAEAARAPSQSDPTPAPPGGGGLRNVLPAIAGGIVALVLAGLLQLAGLLGAPGSGGSDDSALRAELETVRQEVATLAQGGGANARIDGIAAEIETLRNDVAALKSAAGPGDGEAVAALDARVGKLEETIGGLQGGTGAPPADTAQFDGRLTAAETAAKAAGDAVGAFEARIAALEKAAGDLSARMDAQTAQPKAALAIAAAALKAALERGGAFTGELDTLAMLAPQAPGLAELRPFAEKGVATRESLLTSLESATPAMIAADNPVADDAGFFERLFSSAQSLVTVRPVGPVEGTSADAVITRIEAAIRSGDFQAASAEFAALPEPVRAAGASFGAELDARQTAGTLIDAALAAAAGS